MVDSTLFCSYRFLDVYFMRKDVVKLIHNSVYVLHKAMIKFYLSSCIALVTLQSLYHAIPTYISQTIVNDMHTLGACACVCVIYLCVYVYDLYMLVCLYTCSVCMCR